MPEFAFYRESYWKRGHEKKEPNRDVPDIGDYPYREHLYCGYCGSRLSRHIDTKSGSIRWICERYKRQGKSACRGVRISDLEVQKWLPIEKDIYITEVIDSGGKKRYTYSSKKDDDE